ncbi:MAG: Gfo/Idh/MocA family oxidoreductase, partial [Coriobacteriales bacterium]|nr:Gfo/Idh/MocA family oxidoreductase [Coriobacteriales bacterium]
QGCHVLVEKPIALDADGAQAIIDACDKAGVRLCVGHVERYNPAVETLLSIMEREQLFSVDFRRMSPFYGRAADASVVEDLMIHDIDILNALIDRPIKRIVSQGCVTRTDKLDFAQALITYEDGTVASLTASRITESKIRRIDISAANSYINVDCLNRTVEISRQTNFSLDVGYPVQYRQENIVEKVIVPINEPLRSELAHFASAIQSGGPIATSGEMGKRAVELCQRIQDAALIGA